jgi:hypothetical protein
MKHPAHRTVREPSVCRFAPFTNTGHGYANSAKCTERESGDNGARRQGIAFQEMVTMQVADAAL